MKIKNTAHHPIALWKPARGFQKEPPLRKGRLEYPRPLPGIPGRGMPSREIRTFFFDATGFSDRIHARDVHVGYLT